MLISLAEAVRRFSKFKPDWTTGRHESIVENPMFGSLLHVVQCNEQEPQYDFPVWVERPGAVCIPFLESGDIVLVNNWRPAISNGTFPRVDLERAGKWSLELPRGFAEPDEAPITTALREVSEELNCKTIYAEELGECNPNTTFFCNSHKVFKVAVSDLGIRPSGDSQHELIRDYRSFSRREAKTLVKENKIFCGMTLTALCYYLATD